jgi:integrase
VILPTTTSGWEKLAEENGATLYTLTHSEHSRKFYTVGVVRFAEFCTEEKVKEATNRNVYDIILRFARWNDSRGLRGKTIRGYVFAVKALLGAHNVEIKEEKYKNRVRKWLPRVLEIDEDPLTIEKVRVLLSKGKPNKKMRALILVGLSGGMRLAEALHLKFADLDLESNPATIQIRAAYTKNKRNRQIFVSDEARDALKEITEGRAEDELVFPYAGNILAREKAAYDTFAKVKQRALLNDRFQDYMSAFGKVHYHLFRKMFLTKGSDVIGESATNALIGHGFYMDTYYQKPLEERKQDYRKLMPHLTVFGPGPTIQREEIKKEVYRVMLRREGLKPEQIEEIVNDPDVEGKIKYILEHLTVTRVYGKQRQTIVKGRKNFEEKLAEGWTLVPGGKLSDDDFLIEPPVDYTKVGK